MSVPKTKNKQRIRVGAKRGSGPSERKLAIKKTRATSVLSGKYGQRTFMNRDLIYA